MKLRKLSMLCVLVLLATAMVVAPVQAGKTVTPFTFEFDWDTAVITEVRTYTGVMFHSDWSMTAIMISTEPKVGSGELFMELQGAILPDHPHSLPECLKGAGCWGPGPGTFRIVVPPSTGQPESGWEGTVRLNPWADPSKWPNSGLVTFTGNGFGLYKNMHITFTSNGSGEIW